MIIKRNMETSMKNQVENLKNLIKIMIAIVLKGKKENITNKTDTKSQITLDIGETQTIISKTMKIVIKMIGMILEKEISTNHMTDRTKIHIEMTEKIKIDIEKGKTKITLKKEMMDLIKIKVTNSKESKILKKIDLEVLNLNKKYQTI